MNTWLRWNLARGRALAWLTAFGLASTLGLGMVRGEGTMNDSFTLLRQKWVASLVGDERLAVAVPAVRGRVEAQAREAQACWESMVKAPVDDLWPPLQTAKNSAGVSATCGRLGLLARAYATRGSTLFHDPALRADLVRGVRWFLTARYHPGATPYGNWWDWEIGVPLALNPCLACLYDDLPPATLRDGTDAIEAFTPVISATGANGAWRAEIVLRRAILVRDAAKMEVVRDWMGKTMLPYFEPPASPAAGAGFSEGFYRDGSFFAHGRHPYNGGYGLGALGSAVNLLALLAGSPWEVPPPGGDRICEWVANSYEPLLYQGVLFDNLRGREISRGEVTNSQPSAGLHLLEILLTAVDIVPATDRLALCRFVKGMALHGAGGDLPVPAAARLHALLGDPGLPAAAPLTLFRHYPLMARTVMLRAAFGASVSMYSDSVYNYESLNNENLQGWHTGDGWLQILDADATQFSDQYWPTVDWHRLPGTTAVQGSVKPSNRVNGSSWAGGADLDGVNGVTGFELQPFTGEIYDPGTKQMVPATDHQTLTARKSWFMLGDEIFCVGSGITATDAAPVETTVENRRLDLEGGNLLTVDGHPLATVPGQQTVTARWLHLTGNVPGSGLGCVFTEPTRVQTMRETRTGTWKAINAFPGSETPVRRSFLTVWLDHGIRPAAAAYAYVLLPGCDAAAVARYAAAPSTVLLAATKAVHAVSQRKLGIIAANFWEDAPATLPLDGRRTLTVDRKACVLYRHEAGRTELAVSDPTRGNGEAIVFTLNVPLGRVLAAGKHLETVTSSGRTVITLDLTRVEPDDRGHTFRIQWAD